MQLVTRLGHVEAARVKVFYCFVDKVSINDTM